MRKIIKIISLFFLSILLFVICIKDSSAQTVTLNEVSKNKLFGPVGVYRSQYSPWIVYKDGWGSWLMYYCKNVPINNVWQDRVYRIESWTGGLSSWGSDMLVIQGTMGQDDALSCSPGVVIDANGVWHMYYITAKNSPDVPLYMYHATAPAPGVNWAKQGKVNFNGGQPLFNVGVYMETPSPILVGNQMWLYFTGVSGKLYRSVSTDSGYHFSTPVQLQSPSWAQAGRVTYYNGLYYYVYSKEAGWCCDPPTQMYLSVSSDGINFPAGQLIAESNGSDWDGKYMWAPHAFFDNQKLRVYYAGNVGTYDWWGQNTSIGVRVYNVSTPTPTPTPTSTLSPTPTPPPMPTSKPTSTPTLTPIPTPTLPGDINGDGVVNIQDYVLLSNAFGTNDKAADLNDDGIVNIQDFIILSNNFGKTN